jgi:hypothetical protein
MAVPKVVEWHFHPPLRGTLRGLQTFWNMRKWNCPWAHKGGFCSPVCYNRASLGDLWAEYKKKRSSVGLLTSTCHHGRVLLALRDRFENWLWALVVLLIIGYCHLLGYNPGYWLAFLLDIPWEGISYIMEMINSPLCRRWGAE